MRGNYLGKLTVSPALLVKGGAAASLVGVDARCPRASLENAAWHDLALAGDEVINPPERARRSACRWERYPSTPFFGLDRPGRIEPLFPRGGQAARDTLETHGQPQFLVAAVRAVLGADARRTSPSFCHIIILPP